MPFYKEKHATLDSSEYTDNIEIPITLTEPCKIISLRNRSLTIPVSVTISGITTTVNPDETLKDYYEKFKFNSILLETELGHDFVLELYKD